MATDKQRLQKLTKRLAKVRKSLERRKAAMVVVEAKRRFMAGRVAA